MTTATPPVLQAFTVDPAILRSLIDHQATTLARAIAEAVMNAIDAGAHTITLHTSPQEISIRDDGRGLTHAGDIQNYFAVFGFDHTTPHEAHTRQYGHFGMGRGQLFKFGRVRLLRGGNTCAQRVLLGLKWMQ